MAFLHKLFGTYAAPQDANHSKGLKEIEELLSHLPEQQARYLAGFALLLADVAHVDLNVDEDERSRIKDVLEKQTRLDEKQAELVMSLAIERASLHSIERHIIFRRLNEVATPEMKQDLIRGLLYVASSADITEQESEEIGLIAKALGFERKKFLELRSEFREYLAVLRGLPEQK